MEFTVRGALPPDLPGIMRIMETAKARVECPDWFVADEEPFVRERIAEDGRGTDQGFVLVACAPDGEIAGFFLVTYPAPEKNLGRYLSYSREQLARAVTMDSAAVDERYRGHGLQRKMAAAAEERLREGDARYLLCTIHPENRYSLSNMRALGYEVKAEARCYGGLRRYVLEKELGRASGVLGM